MAAATIGVASIGTTPIAGSYPWATPTVTISVPTGTITPAPDGVIPFVVTWVYFSAIGRVQNNYRVQLYNFDKSVLLNDTGGITSAAVSISPLWALPTGQYVVTVTVSDGLASASVDRTFLVDGNTPAASPELRVGSLYEVGINGIGYMLQDQPMDQRLYRQTVYSRKTVPLDAQRIAQADTPLSQAIDRYALNTYLDWTDGAGQRFYDRDSSSARAFYSSVGVDPFTVVGQLSVLPTALTSTSYTAGFTKAVVASSAAYFVTQDTGGGAGIPVKYTTGGAVTTFNIAAATAATAKDICSDGVYWYVADGNGVWRNNTNADPGAAWSASDAMVMEWCSDRLVIARKDATSSTPNCFVELDQTGVEVAAHRFILPEKTTIRSITSGDGYVWIAATRAERSFIYAWKLGDTAYTTAFELPHGQEARTVYFYQGNVMIRSAEVGSNGTVRAIIYRCSTSTGTLSPTRVLDITETGVDHGDGGFAGDDRFVYFGWRRTNGANTEGMGVIDLSTGGWAKGLTGTGGSAHAPVRSIVKLGGLLYFTADDGSGWYVQQAAISTSGQLVTSVLNLGSSQAKRWERIEARFDPLPLGSSILVEYSADSGATWFTAATFSGNGSVSAAVSLTNVQSDSICFRLTLTRGATAAPVLHSLTIKAYQIGLADQVLVLPVNCADQVAGLNDRPLVENAPGAGAARARALENLTQSVVSIQDVDWKVTGVANLWQVVSVDITSVGVFEPHVARQSQAMIAVVTARRALR